MIKKFLTNWKFYLVFLVILCAGVFLRLFKAEYLFQYTHDNDLAGWVIRDIVGNYHLRLIGQETSTTGVFIGALYYYLQIPFYMLTKMDPIGAVLLGALTGLLGMISTYFVFKRVFNQETALVGMLIYGISFYVVLVEKEIVPTALVFVWTVWILYALHLILNGENKKGLVLSGILGGLIWHINFALIIPFSLVLVALVITSQKTKLGDYFIGALTFVLANGPLVVFELRHGFSQTKSIVNSLTQNQNDIIGGWEKVQRVIYLLSKDATSLVFGGAMNFKFEYVLLAIALLFVYLLAKRVITKKIGLIFSLWVILYILFFSSYSKIVSEYYLNGAIIVFIAILSVGIAELVKSKKAHLLGVVCVSLFCTFNYHKLINFQINRSGYFDKKETIRDIDSNRGLHNYPCISVSYITDPGYDRGYRYFIWHRGLKTKPITGDVPVYTIVFPLKPVFKVDRTSGAIGVIYPEFKKYEGKDLTKECEGEDFNSVDSMIGLTI